MLHTMFKWTPVTAASLLAMANVCADPLDARLGALETKVQAMSQKDVRGMTQATAVTARPMIDGADLFATADALYWKATEDGLEYGLRNHISQTQYERFDGTAKTIESDWNAGMRLGLGYNIPYDQWDLNLTWTHFHNTTDSSLDAPPNGYLLGIYTSASVRPVDASLNYDAKWKLQYDTLDLELGRSFFTSKALSLRPFVSARGARIDQDMDLLYSGVDPDLILGHAPFATYLQNKFHAWGARAGMNFNWRFGSHWGLFGKVSGSILYSRFHVSALQKKEVSLTYNEPIYDIENGFHRVRTNLEGGAGLQWDAYANRHRAHLVFTLGYELVQWFDLNHFRNFNNIPNYTESSGDLGLQGVTFSGRVDF